MSDDATLNEFIDNSGDSTESGSATEDYQDTGDLQTLETSPIEDWKLVRLDDILSFEYGDNLPANTRQEGSIPVYGSNGQVDTHTEANVDSEGIIIGRKGSIGKGEFSDKPFWAIDTTYYISDEETDENLRFIYYLLQDMELERLNAASAIPGLNRNDAYNLNTLVPPLSEQRKIATVLHTVDQAIQKTEQIIEQTKRYKSGLKQDIFRGGIGDNTTKELPAIGEIPECWDITTLEDVSEWITDGTHTPYDAKQEGFPCLTGKNIRDYGFNLDDIKLVSEKAFEEMRSRVSPEQGDVLFVKDGSIGYTQVNDLQFEFGLLESVLLIRTNKNKIRPHYLQQLLTWKPFRELLISRRVGTGIERMTISGMKKAEVILPSLEEQNEIEDILLQVDKYIDNESKYLSRLKRFKKGLMQDLLSGEVRTTDVDIDIPEEVAKYG